MNFIEIAMMTGFSYNYVRRKMKGFEPVKKELIHYNWVFYFSIEDVRKAFNINPVPKEKYTIETFVIYESKMNYE